ncbi:MAG: hypothetical protein V3T55_12420, partial [Anaerolineales bacterium]
MKQGDLPHTAILESGISCRTRRTVARQIAISPRLYWTSPGTINSVTRLAAIPDRSRRLSCTVEKI